MVECAIEDEDYWLAKANELFFEPIFCCIEGRALVTVVAGLRAAGRGIVVGFCTLVIIAVSKLNNYKVLQLTARKLAL